MTLRGQKQAPTALWSADDLMVLSSLYPDSTTKDIAAKLGKNQHQIYRKAAMLGLKKSDAFYASSLAGRISNANSRGRSTQFKPGQRPWNAGTKGLMIGGIETQFRPGHKPHNYVPVGSYRVAPDGTLQRKISEIPGANSKRWRGVHELVWIEANGPVPPKHIVVFKLGQRTTVLEEITLDRIECITWADNMRRNSVHARMPKELAQLVQLRGALQRQINKRSKHHEQ